MSHRLHPDPSRERGYPDPFEAVLYDDCFDCDRYAERPDRLDEVTLGRLLNLHAARTDNEAKALSVIDWAGRLTRRAAMVAPLAVPR